MPFIIPKLSNYFSIFQLYLLLLNSPMVLLSVLALYLLSFLWVPRIYPPKFTQKNKKSINTIVAYFKNFNSFIFLLFPFHISKFCLVDYISFLNPKGLFYPLTHYHLVKPFHEIGFFCDIVIPIFKIFQISAICV